MGNKKARRWLQAFICKWLRELDLTPRGWRGVCRRQTTLKHALACAMDDALVRVLSRWATKKPAGGCRLSFVSGSASWTRTNDPLINSHKKHKSQANRNFRT